VFDVGAALPMLVLGAGEVIAATQTSALGAGVLDVDARRWLARSQSGMMLAQKGNTVRGKAVAARSGSWVSVQGWRSVRRNRRERWRAFLCPRGGPRNTTSVRLTAHAARVSVRLNRRGVLARHGGQR
jgi:hypothetical protein